MGGTESQAICRVGQTVLARLMESQIWHQPVALLIYGSVWREPRKGQWPLFTSLRENCHPAFTLMPDTSVSPCMPLVPFKLLPQCWRSEGVNLSKSMCGFSKWNCLGLHHFSVPTHPCRFCSQKLWGLTFLALEP